MRLPDNIRKAAADGAELVIYYGWNSARCRKFKITDEGIELSQDEVGYRHDGTCRIVFENMPSAFLRPGPWRLDAKSSQVLYLPLTPLTDAEFIAPGREEHSVFRCGPRPTGFRLRAEKVPEALVRLYEEYLIGAK